MKAIHYYNGPMDRNGKYRNGDNYLNWEEVLEFLEDNWHIFMAWREKVALADANRRRDGLNGEIVKHIAVPFVLERISGTFTNTDGQKPAYLTDDLYVRITPFAIEVWATYNDFPIWEVCA